MLFIKTPRDRKMLPAAHLQVWMLLKVHREFRVEATKGATSEKVASQQT